MIILLQYTLTDIRRLSNTKSLLIFPKWPLPVPYKEFVRGNGQIVPKTDNGVITFLGRTCITENFVCKIHKGVRIPKKIEFKRKNEYVLLNKINHYFSDGGILAKFEFVFNTTSPVEHLAYDDFRELLNTILETPITIRNTSFKYGKYNFKTCFKGLRELQIASSTMLKGFFNLEAEMKYILKCTPQIFVSLSKKESVDFVNKSEITTQLNDPEQSLIGGWWEKYNNHPYKIWLLKNKGAADNKIIQSIRSGILRIHSEKECINNVIQSVLLGYLRVTPRTSESDILQSFLNNKIRDVDTNFKKIQPLDKEKEIEMFIKQVHNQFNPGEITLLNKRIQALGFRPQIQKKLINHVVTYSNYIENQNINHMSNNQNMSFGAGTNINAPITQQMNNNNFNQENLKEFYNNLDELLKKIENEPNSFEKEVAKLNLGKAQTAVVEKDESSFKKHLKEAGKWTADFASKAGVNIISELIKAQLKQ